MYRPRTKPEKMIGTASQCNMRAVLVYRDGVIGYF